MPLPPTRFEYQSPPGSGSNDGALPKVYDPAWGKWINLTPQQKAAFEAFPQDLITYTKYSRWVWEVCASATPGPPASYITIPADGSGIAGMQIFMDDRSQNKITTMAQDVASGVLTPPIAFLAFNGTYSLQASDCSALHGYVARYVQQTYTIAASLIAQINAGTVTTRAQIDAAFAAIVVQ